jgi:LPXTG-motif cell wall-anchored protein
MRKEAEIMNKRKMHVHPLLVFLTLISGSFLFWQSPAYGMQADVQTNGEIVFTESSTTTSSDHSTESSSKPLIEKPQGKFPSTGELIQKSLLISGFLLLVLVLLIYIVKQKRMGKDDKSK